MPVWWERVRHLLSMPALDHGTLPDLRALESTRVRVKGTPYRVHDPERGIAGDRLYVLRREPGNRRHSAAIAVYAEGRGIGYVSTVRAERMAPLLDRIGGAALVNGVGADTDSIRLWVDLPDEDALRDFVHSYPRD